MVQDTSLPNIDTTQWHVPEQHGFATNYSAHAPRILLLYGSLRQRSYSRLVVEESARILTQFGAEVRIFNPQGLPQTDTADESHPKVKELRELMKFTLLLRDNKEYFVDSYSERVESAEKVSQRVNQRSL